MIEEAESQTTEDIFDPQLPIRIPRDARGRISWSTLRENPLQIQLVIRSEAYQFQQQEGRFTQELLFEKGRGDLGNAISQFYPGRITQLKIDLGDPEDTRTKWSVIRKDDPEEALRAIEAEAQRAISLGIKLEAKALRESEECAGLVNAVYRFYPGGLSALQERFRTEPPIFNHAELLEVSDGDESAKIPSYPQGNIKWAELVKDSERLIAVIEELTFKHLICDPLTRRAHIMMPQGRFLFDVARKYYPGGMQALKDKLGVYSPPHGSIFSRLKNDPERLQTEIELAVSRLNLSVISQQVLVDLGQVTLWNVISKFYPGGLTALAENLGIGRVQKPHRYWTPQRTEQQCRAFFEEHGGLTLDLLVQHNRNDLYGAIAKYPGRMLGLKIAIGVKPSRKDNFWTEDTIESEAKKFYEEHGTIAQPILSELGRDDLALAIVRHYPGKWHGLREKLGFKRLQRPFGYWTPENIEKEAAAFVAEFGILSSTILQKMRPDLRDAAKKYPGGIRALREKMGIDLDNRATIISSEEANEQLRRLLEG